MAKPKLVRITTIPLSLNLLIRGQMKFMQENGWEVYAVSADGPEVAEIIHRENVSHSVILMTRKITPWQDIRAIYCLYRWLKSIKPHVVHTHTPKAGFVGMLAARLAGVKHRLHTVAGMPLLEARGIRRMALEYVEALTYSCATRVYPNSLNMRSIILREFSVPPEKVVVIGHGSSNGIDSHYFMLNDEVKARAEIIKKEIDFSESELVFCFVGRIVRDKGINELITAFMQLLEIHPEARLLLVGAREEDLDPLRQDTTQLIRDTPAIVTVGFQQDIRPYLALSDVFVFPSYREGFPNVVLQAGCMNLPSIVTDINGCNEIIIDGENGLIIPPKNVPRLVDAMRELADESELRERLARNARIRVVRDFEQGEIWKALLEEYNRLI